MNWLIKTSTSSVGKKALVGVTGILLFLYLIIHLAGNLIIYQGNDAFNKYAKILNSIPILPAIEVALAAVFIIHIFFVIRVAIENRKARGNQRYEIYQTKRTSKSETLASRTMMLSGIIVLIFLSVHVYDFRLHLHEETDLALKVKSTLINPFMASLYILGSLLIGWHLFHGVQSAFRSIGVNHPKYTPIIEKLGFIFSLALGLGFATIPLFIWIGVVR